MATGFDQVLVDSVAVMIFFQKDFERGVYRFETQ